MPERHVTNIVSEELKAKWKNTFGRIDAKLIVYLMISYTVTQTFLTIAVFYYSQFPHTYSTKIWQRIGKENKNNRESLAKPCALASI